MFAAPDAADNFTIYGALEEQVHYLTIVFDMDYALVDTAAFKTLLENQIQQAAISPADVLAISLAEGSIVATLSLRSQLVADTVTAAINAGNITATFDDEGSSGASVVVVGYFATTSAPTAAAPATAATDQSPPDPPATLAPGTTVTVPPGGWAGDDNLAAASQGISDTSIGMISGACLLIFIVYVVVRHHREKSEFAADPNKGKEFVEANLRYKPYPGFQQPGGAQVQVQQNYLDPIPFGAASPTPPRQSPHFRPMGGFASPLGPKRLGGVSTSPAGKQYSPGAVSTDWTEVEAMLDHRSSLSPPQRTLRTPIQTHNTLVNDMLTDHNLPLTAANAAHAQHALARVGIQHDAMVPNEVPIHHTTRGTQMTPGGKGGGKAKARGNNRRESIGSPGYLSVFPEMTESANEMDNTDEYKQFEQLLSGSSWYGTTDATARAVGPNPVAQKLSTSLLDGDGEGYFSSDAENDELRNYSLPVMDKRNPGTTAVPRGVSPDILSKANQQMRGWSEWSSPGNQQMRGWSEWNSPGNRSEPEGVGYISVFARCSFKQMLCTR